MQAKLQSPRFSQTLVALAVLAALGQVVGPQAAAQEGSISVGAGYATGDNKDRARFGLYNGLGDHDLYGLLGFDLASRDAASGITMNVQGRNLGLDGRDASLAVRQLGDWKISAGYNEIVRQDPRTINTGLLGAGTTTPSVVLLSAPGAGNELDLKLKRKAINLGVDKWLLPSLQFEASFKNEDKSGSRIFGRGFACSAAWVSAGSCASSTTQWALLMLPEPVNSTIKQFEAKLNFSTDKLFLSGGYYGSFYTNSNGNLTPTIPGTLLNPLGQPQALDAGLRATLGLPMALQPESQAHQFSLAGNYRFTNTTKATFKYAYTHATQNEDFLGMGLAGAPAGVSSLRGEMNTSIAQVGLTSRPMRGLSLLANVRYEDKDNKTPIAYYNVEGANKFTNANPSPKKLAARAEGSYQLPQGFRGTLGVDYEKVDHGSFTPTSAVAGLSGLRQKTEEQGFRVELAKNMSETLAGSISYIHSKREGDSPWLKPLALPLTGVVEANPDPTCVVPAAPAINTCIYNRTGIFPHIFEDRKRDKLRLSGVWSPTDQLSVQLFVEDGKDKFSGPTQHGLRDTGLKMYSLDAVYALSPGWKITAYATYGDSTIHAGHSTGYDAALNDKTYAFGIGTGGKVAERLQTGVDITYIRDKLTYQQDLDPLASATNIAFLAASGGLPDVTYRLLRAKVYGDYALDSRSSIRLDLVHERSLFNEWTWRNNNVPFYYSDNTTVYAQEHQNVTFVGISYIYRW